MIKKEKTTDNIKPTNKDLKTLKQHIESLLKHTKFSDEKGVLFVNKILEAIEKIDTDLVEILIKDDKAKKHFFSKVLDTYVMNQLKLIDFFSMNNYFEESYTSYTNKIGLIRKDDFIKKNNDVVLAFPYKDCVLEGGQTKEDQKGKENFFNEILDSDEIDRLFEPKVLTNIKRYSKDGVEENPTITDKDNLILKGNNLLALHSLKKKYVGKVKLIYIDPPYNTGNDSFGYNDNFNHSTWLTFMKNRLEVSRELLRDDGVMFVQCDNNEQAYLKVLMDEVFDKDNYVTSITVKSKTPSGVGQESYIFDITETIHLYSKKISLLEQNNYKIFDEVVNESSKTARNYKFIIKDYGKEKDSKILTSAGGTKLKLVELDEFQYESVKKTDCTQKWYYENYECIFRLSPANGGMMKKITPLIPKTPCYLEYVPSKGKYANKLIKIYFIKREMVVFIRESSERDEKKKIVNKLVNIHNNWTQESLWQGISNEGKVTLKNGKKPEALIQRILDIATNPDDLILDFHLGSGTTCAVAHKMGRQYIGVEQMGYIEDLAVTRLNNTINDDSTGISKSVNWQGGGNFVYAELKQVSNFDNADKKLKQEMRYLPIGELEDEDYKISKEEIAINKSFYGVSDE